MDADTDTDTDTDTDADAERVEQEHRTAFLTEVASRSERELVQMANFYREHGFEAEAGQIAEEVRELKARHDQSC